jgi:hypothetical protein
LKKEFGNKNLLVIGSPASNHLSRKVNKTGIFRFEVDPNVEERARELYNQIQRDASNVQLLRKHHLDQQTMLRCLMNEFRRAGFVDPTFPQGVRGRVVLPNEDYGVVTICRNPYAKDSKYVSILAGGVHAPGTMHAVKYLGDSKIQFKKRPLGGVFKVNIPPTESWERRLLDSDPIWSTPEYEIGSLLCDFDSLKQNIDWTAARITPEEITDIKSFIKDLSVK